MTNIDLTALEIYVYLRTVITGTPCILIGLRVTGFVCGFSYKAVVLNHSCLYPL